MVPSAGCGRPSDAERVEPIPTFAASAAPNAAAPRPRTTLLPTDCAEVISGDTMSALLGQPMGSVQARTVLGQPAPSVGRLERVTCLYLRGRPLVTVNLGAYSTPTAADSQLSTNVSAERGEARSVQQLSIGSAKAVLLDERDQTVLMVASGRSGMTLGLNHGAVPPRYIQPIMVDMAQRMLPTLVPRKTTEPR
ncbi:MAG TPA: hypothetical protein VGH99_14515 [Pseudonocardia sp.]